MTISMDIHLFRPVFTIQGYIPIFKHIPNPRGHDLLSTKLQILWVFPVYLASEVQKRSNAPVPGQILATKVSKSGAIPPYVPRVNPPG